MRCWIAVLLLPLHVLAASPPQSVWLNASGRPTASARDALRLLAEVPASVTVR
jgi:hypothetical protein